MMKMTANNPVDGLPAIHPGEFLRETLEDLAMTQAAFADAIGVSAMRVSHLLKGDRPSRPNWLCALVVHWVKRLNIGSTCYLRRT